MSLCWSARLYLSVLLWATNRSAVRFCLIFQKCYVNFTSVLFFLLHNSTGSQQSIFENIWNVKRALTAFQCRDCSLFIWSLSGTCSFSELKSHLSLKHGFLNAFHRSSYQADNTVNICCICLCENFSPLTSHDSLISGSAWHFSLARCVISWHTLLAHMPYICLFFPP